MPTEEGINEKCVNALIAASDEIQKNISELNDIVTYLYSKFVISDLQRTQIMRADLVLHERIEKLLTIIQSGKQRNFEEFIKSLIFTNRNHVVTLINNALEEQEYDIIDIEKMKAYLKSSHKTFKTAKLEYIKTNTYPNSGGASGGPPQLPDMAGIVPHVNPNTGMTFLNMNEPDFYAPVIDKYEFDSRFCAILQIHNYNFTHNSPRSGYDEEKIAFNRLKQRFNISVISNIPVMTVENSRVTQNNQIVQKGILSAVDDFIHAIQSSKAERIDGCAVFIATHGINEKLSDADGVLVEIEKIFDKFSFSNCSKLAKKPKLFFIEACRGDNPDRPNSGPGTAKWDRTLSSMDDIYVAFSTGWGYYSANHDTTGSYFIQALTEVLCHKTNEGDEIEEILKKVHAVVCKLRKIRSNDNMAITNRTTNQTTTEKVAQSPGSYSHLTKKLILFPVPPVPPTPSVLPRSDHSIVDMPDEGQTH